MSDFRFSVLFCDAILVRRDVVSGKGERNNQLLLSFSLDQILHPLYLLFHDLRMMMFCFSRPCRAMSHQSSVVVGGIQAVLTVVRGVRESMSVL